MAYQPLEEGRLEWRFGGYVLSGKPLEENEWLSVEYGGTVHVGRYVGINPAEDNRPTLLVYRDRDGTGRLTFPPEATTVRRLSESEALRRSQRPYNYDRVQQALDDVEAAERLLEKAARELSPVPGYANEWTDVGQLGNHAHELWRKLDSRRVEIAAHTLRLGDDGNGPRYFLTGRPVHSGDQLQMDTGDGWETARFEWTHDLDDPPLLLYPNGRAVPLPESDETTLVLFRWVKPTVT